MLDGVVDQGSDIADVDNGADTRDGEVGLRTGRVGCAGEDCPDREDCFTDCGGGFGRDQRGPDDEAGGRWRQLLVVQMNCKKGCGTYTGFIAVMVKDGLFEFLTAQKAFSLAVLLAE